VEQGAEATEREGDRNCNGILRAEMGMYLGPLPPLQWFDSCWGEREIPGKGNWEKRKGKWRRHRAALA